LTTSHKVGLREEKIGYEILNVFGPKIGVVKLNDFIINKMIEITDNLLKDDTRKSNGFQLAGQISEEPMIDLDVLKESGLSEVFKQILVQHANSVINVEEEIEINITEMWMVSQYENEYNPIHWHEGCTLSCTLYLKIPEYKPRSIPGKKNRDGQIAFINSNPSSPFVSMETPMITVPPEVGDMFIFPSRMLHCVYPFQGEGERRSVAFNALHQIANEKPFKIYYTK